LSSFPGDSATAALDHTVTPDHPNFRGVFDPIGHCVYCLRDDLPLSREHIVPFALNGKLILPRASCTPCARTTGHQLERSVLRNTFLNIRARIGMKTRNPANRPLTFPAEIEYADGRKESKNVPISEWPAYTWILPQFAFPPRALSLSPFDANAGFVTMRVNGMRKFDFLKIGGPGTRVTVYSDSIHLAYFCRVLAKIAHCFAYGLLGKDGFEPCLVPFILSKKGCTLDDCTFFIGADSEPTEAEASTVTAKLDERQGADGQAWLCATVQILGYAGAPSYVVVVGKRRGDKLFQLKHRSYTQPIELLIA
jgi:hypothetical protein